MNAITIMPNEKAFDRTAAWRIIAQILNKSDSVIGLSTGRTTGNMHRLVGSIYHANPFDVSHITFFGQDEVTGVPREYSGACYTMLKTEIINTLGITEDNFLMLPTTSKDFKKECKHFTTEINKRGGIDLLILGLGENGHLGFNQPGSPFGSETRTTKMHPELEVRIRKETGISHEKELGGVTLGLKEIMQARHIILVAKGKHKAEAVKRMIEGSVCTDCPASILQLHPNCEFLLDADAAGLLSK